MGKKQKKDRPKITCFCYGIPEADIVEAIEKGASTLMDVRRETNANTGCGGCGEDVKRLLRKHVGKTKVPNKENAQSATTVDSASSESAKKSGQSNSANSRENSGESNSD